MNCFEPLAELTVKSPTDCEIVFPCWICSMEGNILTVHVCGTSVLLFMAL